MIVKIYFLAFTAFSEFLSGLNFRQLTLYLRIFANIREFDETLRHLRNRIDLKNSAFNFLQIMTSQLNFLRVQLKLKLPPVKIYPLVFLLDLVWLLKAFSAEVFFGVNAAFAIKS